MRLLLVRLSALGDVAMALHVLAAVKARDPGARVGWVVEDRFAGLLDGHPQIDALHVYERRRARVPWALWRFARTLRAERYDVALDLQGNLKSGVLARLAGARRTLGLDAPLAREGNGLLVRERVKPPDGHRLLAYLALVERALGPGPAAPAVLPAKGDPHGAIVLHPGVSPFGAFKRWPAAAFADLGDRLASRLGASVILTAGPGERAQADDVLRRMRRSATVVEPKGLRPLADLLRGARIVIASDTGPAHIAAALGVPTLTLFGPKDPDVMAPVGPRARAVRAGVRCSPCALRSCPDPVCMSQLPVDLVEREAVELLA